MQRITQVHNISAEDLKKEIVDDVSTNIGVIVRKIVSDLKPPKETIFINSKEACSILGITPPTLLDWRKRKIIPAYRIANKIRFKKSDVMKSLKKINH